MDLYMYTDVVLTKLKNHIEDNLPLYKSGLKFVNNIIDNYDDKLFSLDKDVLYPNLIMPNKEDSSKKQWEIDFENSVIFHKDFTTKYSIPLKIITDERFISYLTHDIYYDYMVKRWPIEDKIQKVKERYFFTSNQAFTRNALLRLLWYPFITFDSSLEDPYELTKIAFEFADPVNQIMERKYSKNKKIVIAALKAIKETPNSKVLNNKRTIFGKAINNILGTISLDIMSEERLISLFKLEIEKIVNDKIVDLDDTIE